MRSRGFQRGSAGCGTALLPAQEQARLLHMTSLAGYKQLKFSVMATTLSLVATGSSILWCLDGSVSALPFALGGAAGLAYQYILQRRIDAVAGGVGPTKARPLAARHTQRSATQHSPGMACVQSLEEQPACRRSAYLAEQLARCTSVRRSLPASTCSPAPACEGGRQPSEAAVARRQVRSGRTLQRLVSSGPLRILLAAAAAVASLWGLEQASVNLGAVALPASGPDQVRAGAVHRHSVVAHRGGPALAQQPRQHSRCQVSGPPALTEPRAARWPGRASAARVGRSSPAPAEALPRRACAAGAPPGLHDGRLHGAADGGGRPGILPDRPARFQGARQQALTQRGSQRPSGQLTRPLASRCICTTL